MLSKRLQKIAELIEDNKVVCDVGSDHALLPCFLVLNNKCKKAYAVDNKEGPYRKAIANIEKYGLNDKVIPVLANGIDNIASDVNIIVIAGMGFFTVKEILDGKDLSSYDKIIVQINKDTSLLREWLNKKRYSIIDEQIVKDDFYYEIVVFNANQAQELKPLEIKYGPINIKNRNIEFIEYLKYKQEKLISINKKAKKIEYQENIEEIEMILRDIID